MDKKKGEGGFERDGKNNLVCDNLAGQDFKACNELRKKEIGDDLPRDADGKLVCENLDGDAKSICMRQKASEAAKKSIGMKEDD